MYELPDEIWNLIKEFALDWKRTHKQKMKHIFDLQEINEKGHIKMWGEVIYTKWAYDGPWLNTNEIIDEEYNGNTNHPYAPPSDLERVYICKHKLISTCGMWCGYGWRRRVFVAKIIDNLIIKN